LISEEAQIIAEFKTDSSWASAIYWLALCSKVCFVLTCVLLVDAFRRIGRLKLKDLIITK